MANRQIGEELNVSERQIQRRLKLLWGMWHRELDGSEDDV